MHGLILFIATSYYKRNILVSAECYFFLIVQELGVEIPSRTLYVLKVAAVRPQRVVVVIIDGCGVRTAHRRLLCVKLDLLLGPIFLVGKPLLHQLELVFIFNAFLDEEVVKDFRDLDEAHWLLSHWEEVAAQTHVAYIFQVGPNVEEVAHEVLPLKVISELFLVHHGDLGLHQLFHELLFLHVEVLSLRYNPFLQESLDLSLIEVPMHAQLSLDGRVIPEELRVQNPQLLDLVDLCHHLPELPLPPPSAHALAAPVLLFLLGFL